MVAQMPPVTESLRWRADQHSIEQLLVLIRPLHYPRDLTLYVAGYEDQALPNADQCRKLAESGVSNIVLEETVRLSVPGSLREFEAVRFLRDTVPCGIRVLWNHDQEGSLAVGHLLRHLWPPSAQIDSPKPKLFGLFYWRRGPGFILVQDIRPGREACKYVLDEPDLVELFLMLQQPIRLLGVPDRLRNALKQLSNEEMLYRSADYVLSLPCRVVKWPTPFSAF